MFTPRQLRAAELDIDDPRWYRRSSGAARGQVYWERKQVESLRKMERREAIRLDPVAQARRKATFAVLAVSLPVLIVVPVLTPMALVLVLIVRSRIK